MNVNASKPLLYHIHPRMITWTEKYIINQYQIWIKQIVIYTLFIEALEGITSTDCSRLHSIAYNLVIKKGSCNLRVNISIPPRMAFWIYITESNWTVSFLLVLEHKLYSQGKLKCPRCRKSCQRRWRFYFTCYAFTFH